MGEALCFLSISFCSFAFLNLMRSHPYLRRLQLLHQSHTTLPSLSLISFALQTSHCLCIIIIIIHYFQTFTSIPSQRFVLFALIHSKFLQNSFVCFSFWILPLSRRLCVWSHLCLVRSLLWLVCCLLFFSQSAFVLSYRWSFEKLSQIHFIWIWFVKKWIAFPLKRYHLFFFAFIHLFIRIFTSESYSWFTCL